MNPPAEVRTARIPDPDPSVPRPRLISHLVLRSPRKDEMVRWYRTVFHAKPMLENPAVCFLTWDDHHHRVMIAGDPRLEAPNPRAWGVVHWAYSYASLEELVVTWERLEKEGIAPHSCVNHGFTLSYYYHDPDGNEVELAVDNYPDKDTMNAWFATGAFDRNFFGFEVDPTEIARRHRAGDPHHEIVTGYA